MFYIEIPESIATPLAVVAVVLLVIAFGYICWRMANDLQK
jgi:hypothetical protein